MNPILLILLVLIPLSASSLTTSYTNRAKWETSVPGKFVTDDLTQYGTKGFHLDLTVDLGPFSYTTQEGTSFQYIVHDGRIGGFVCDAYPDDGCPTRFNYIDFPQPIYWFGLDFTSVEDNDSPNDDTDETRGVLATVNGTSLEVFTGDFAGWVSDKPFTRVVIDGLIDTQFIVVDNLSYPRLLLTPEPNTGLLTLLGLLVLTLIFRRRQVSC